MILDNISDHAKHTADAVAGTAFGASIAAWLIAQTSLFTATTALLVGIYTLLRIAEVVQRIYLNWRNGYVTGVRDE